MKGSAGQPAPSWPHKAGRRRGDWLLVVILSILGFLTFVPVLMLIELSFKTQQQMADSMWLPTLPLHVSNYVNAWFVMSPYVLNSVWFVLGTVAISIVCSALSAYALSRYRFPGREFFYIAILALLMIPGVLTLITRFVTVVDLHLNNTYLGVWLPMAAAAQPFQIIVLRTFFASIPEDFFEAGRLDGASELRMMVEIALAPGHADHRDARSPAGAGCLERVCLADHDLFAARALPGHAGSPAAWQPDARRQPR